jgi:hypothetical protein
LSWPPPTATTSATVRSCVAVVVMKRSVKSVVTGCPSAFSSFVHAPCARSLLEDPKTSKVAGRKGFARRRSRTPTGPAGCRRGRWRCPRPPSKRTRPGRSCPGRPTLEGPRSRASAGGVAQLTDRASSGRGLPAAAPAPCRGRPRAAAGGAVERHLRPRGRRGRCPRGRGVMAVTWGRHQGHVRCPGGVQPHAPGV